jgi:2-keto-4-pentenoate hydratase
MLNPGRIEDAASALAYQRICSLPVDLAEHMRPGDETEAYAIQSEANGRLSRNGLGLPVGHKIGCTTPVMQSFLGIHSPCAGDIFASSVLRSGQKISGAGYRRLGVECEIAVEIARDIPPESSPFTRETIASAISAVMAAIEIVDDRYLDFRSLGVPTLIADNFFNAGCVLGDPVRDWRRLDLAHLEGRLIINGKETGRGAGAMVLGHPLEALVWLANSRASRGLGLQQGNFVLLGSLVETSWVSGGGSVRIEIEELGALDLSVLS